MDKIRIGNDIHIEWSIFRDNQPEVFEGKDVEVRLIHTRIRDVIPLEWVISDGVVSATFYGKDQIDTGDYKLMLIENNGLPNMATIDECKAFSLVQCSCQEEKEEPSTSLQLHKVQLSSSFALSGGGNISVEGYPNVDELEEVKELSGNENIIITDSEGNKKTTIGNLKEYVVKDISELPPFRIFENESDYNAVKDELGDCVVCLRDTGVLLYHVYGKAEDGGGEIEDKYIRFADPEVQRILAENFSSDGVGMTSEDIAKVTSIGTVFKGNTTIENFDEFEKFTGVTFLGPSTNQTSGGAFNGCTSLQSIKLPPSVTHLRPGAFYNCTSLRSAGDLSNIKHIGICAFAETLLDGEINLASAEGEIGYQSFKKTNITKILSLGNATTLGGTTPIGNSAFGYCSLLESIDLSKIQILQTGALAYCISLKEVFCPSITDIQFYAFYNCTTLTLCNIGENVIHIGAYAFNKCSSLVAVIIRAKTPPTLDDANAFTSTNNCPIYVPDASVEAYKGATNWNTYADRIKGISELPTDNAELYEEIKDYLN